MLCQQRSSALARLGCLQAQWQGEQKKQEKLGRTVEACAVLKRFIMWTMAAFWEGEARHTTTPLQRLASSASSGSASVPRMRLSVRPSTTISAAASACKTQIEL